MSTEGDLTIRLIVRGLAVVMAGKGNLGQWRAHFQQDSTVFIDTGESDRRVEERSRSPGRQTVR